MTKGTPASSQIICLEQMVERQAARIAELKAALKPFADRCAYMESLNCYTYTDDDWLDVRVRYLRAARAAYLGEKE